MEGADYLRGLLRSWWLILLVTLAGGAGGYALYDQATPQYASSVRMIVASDSPGADEQSARALTDLRATTMAGVAATKPVLEAAAEAAGLDSAGSLTAAASHDDSFVDVLISGPDAATAQAVAAAYPKILPKETDRLAGASGTPFTLNLVDAPVVATEPFEPVLTKDVGLGLGVGLLLGLALAILRETLNRSIRDSEELRQITGLTILGIVPRDLPKVLLPADTQPRSARAEAYRQVRTTLLSATDKRPLAVAVTSATQGEGKTSVASNLAVVLSRAGQRVALVDADLRRPRVADYFDIKSRVGLTDVLTGEVQLVDAMEFRNEDRFAILTSGSIPTNPSEALGSPAMREVLDELKHAFDVVIIDTPPVLPVTDALVIGAEVDGIILIARLGYTTRERLERAQASIERIDTRLFGIVPNCAGKGSDADYSYQYKSTPPPAGVEEGTVTPDARLHSARSSGSSSGKHRAKPTVPVEPRTDPSAESQSPSDRI